MVSGERWITMRFLENAGLQCGFWRVLDNQQQQMYGIINALVNVCV